MISLIKFKVVIIIAMDSILELETAEVTQIVEQIAEARDLFKTNAGALFEDAFLVLTSTGAKTD